MKSNSNKARLPPPNFYWGAGLENCWIAQADPQKDGHRRVLDVFLQMQHYEKWKQDLDLAAEVGVNALRYSVPWYKAEPRPGVYDWSWIDGPVDYMVNQLKIIPIMDIIHYGTPTWMPDGVQDDRFPDALAAYAFAMAKHFRGLVDHYTPHNEPQATCSLCGLWARWPPYRQSADAWARLGCHVAKAMILETQALREALPDPVLISADVSLEQALAGSLPVMKERAGNTQEFRTAAALFPASLVYGKVDPDHPFAAFLEDCGATHQAIDWCYRHAQLPSVFGFNYYPDLFDFPGGDFARESELPLAQAARQAVLLLAKRLREAQIWSGLPIYLTETSAGRQEQAKVAFILALYEGVCELRDSGLPLIGVNWWPLYETITWDYREQSEKPLEAFLQPGGWNNGLYTIVPQPAGDLKRVPTEAARAYRDVIERDTLKRQEPAGTIIQEE